MSDEAEVPAQDKVAVTVEDPMAKLLLEGDISSMNGIQKAQYCWKLAESLGLNPWTRPFDILTLSGKTVVYANKTAADQIRLNRGITSRVIYHGQLLLGMDGDNKPILRPDVYQVILELRDKEDRTETATGCVNISGYQGEALSNQIMKCWTKAMRRGTLSMGGLGFNDRETEMDTFQSGSDNVPAPAFQPQVAKPGPAPTLPPQPLPVAAVAVDVTPQAPVTSPAAASTRKPLPVSGPTPIKPPQKGI